MPVWWVGSVLVKKPALGGLISSGMEGDLRLNACAEGRFFLP